MAVMEDKIYHPIQKDAVTFLRTARETNGEYLLVEVELAPHGGNGLHSHLTFTESFEAVEGELHLHNDGQDLVLRPGERASVPPGIIHRFYNESDHPIRFQTEIRPPGQFEQALRIAYGLAVDGKVARNGAPKNPLQLALLFVMTDTYLAAAPVWLQKGLAAPLATLARLFKVERSFDTYLTGRSAEL